ncbi:spore coat assembly protein [Paenibacillus shirakamiensis]|uniref:Spore coat assembly protein n=1 Tax=Paenibacillus shirakamiensis TaxID=1265935 RepID=A0ABS4JLV6_9BACL|nr:sporulation peptidase YabG [Paenibacillus shirakamiensis]MBP2002695.1 spore coat assembly protein [Paenibacillus shirakamiensis]
MELTNLGDLVVRRSYGGDVTFRVELIERTRAIIKGVDFRLVADAPFSDLVQVSTPPPSEKLQQAKIKATESLERLEKDRRALVERTREELMSELYSSNAPSYFEVPGKVLHLDGDANYLKKSLELYEKLRVPAEGYYVSESRMADAVYRLLPKVNPDILVLTGHDGVLKNQMNYDLYNLNSYKNSRNFVDAIQTARSYERNFDALTIVAGACQSHFEALLQSGANFASSPARILIHALDPVYIAAKASFTPIRSTLHITDVLNHTVSGIQGVGGIETRGSYRIGLPKLRDLSTLTVVPSIQ